MARAYERLRAEVLAGGTGLRPPAGLGVFLRQGMVGWMRAVSLSLPARSSAIEPCRGAPDQELAPGLAGELVGLVAQMLLERLEVRG